MGECVLTVTHVCGFKDVCVCKWQELGVSTR